MNRWFRFYSEVLDDPKVQRLDGDTFKAWVNLLCLANRNEGYLPSLSDTAFALRVDDAAAKDMVDRLNGAALLDKVGGGPHGYRYAPHAWRERQYKSDTSTERVKRFRQRCKTEEETASESRTDTNPDIDPEADTNAENLSERPGNEAPWACPEGVDPQHWRDFLKNRRTKRLANSQTAYEGQLRSLALLADNDWPPGKLVQHAAERGWATICDPRTSKYGTSSPPSNTGIGRTEAAAIAALSGR